MPAAGATQALRIAAGRCGKGPALNTILGRPWPRRKKQEGLKGKCE